MTVGPTTSTCPACAGAARGAFAKDGHRYLTCGSCASAWLDRRPDDVADLYDRGYFSGGGHGGYADYAADADLHRRNAGHRLDLAEPRSAGLVVDVGCAYGYGLDAAAERGHPTLGVEVSAHARAVADERGHRVVPTLGEVPGRSAALVCFTQVLEHMPDPLAELTDARRILEEEGTVLIETWDRASALARILGPRWHQVTPPTVLHLWTRTGITRLMVRAGFSGVGVRRWSKQVSIGWAGGIAAEKSALGRALHKATTTARLDRITLPYGPGDLILVTAKRP